MVSTRKRSYSPTQNDSGYDSEANAEQPVIKRPKPAIAESNKRKRKINAMSGGSEVKMNSMGESNVSGNSENDSNEIISKKPKISTNENASTISTSTTTTTNSEFLSSTQESPAESIRKNIVQIINQNQFNGKKGGIIKALKDEFEKYMPEKQCSFAATAGGGDFSTNFKGICRRSKEAAGGGGGVGGDFWVFARRRRRRRRRSFSKNEYTAEKPSSTNCCTENEIMCVECPEACAKNGNCKNRFISNRSELKIENDLELFHTAQKGYGIRAKREIPEGTFIGDYNGEVINEAEKNRRYRKKKKCGSTTFYMMKLEKFYIDAEHFGSHMRYLNHSCDPNCETKLYIASDGLPHICLFSIKNISIGEELTFKYSPNNRQQNEQEYECYCGAKNSKHYFIA